MADTADKELEDAEKAYAAAAEAVPAKVEPAKPEPVAPVAETAPAPAAPLKGELVKTAPKHVPAKPAPPAKAKTRPASAKVKPVARAKPKPIIKAKPQPALKPKPVAMPLAAKPAKATPKPLPKAPPAPKKPIFELKEPIMAKTPDFTKSVTDAVAEFQTKTKAAYDKSAEIAGEVTEFAKGNVEAFVESAKIYSEGVQEFGKSYVEEAKSAFETATADLKEIAAIKSPTELFQLQGKLARRNFDSLVAFGSKSSEALVKLTNESIAPLSSRMSLAADKISKAA